MRIEFTSLILARLLTLQTSTSESASASTSNTSSSSNTTITTTSSLSTLTMHLGGNSGIYDFKSSVDGDSGSSSSSSSSSSSITNIMSSNETDNSSNLYDLSETFKSVNSWPRSLLDVCSSWQTEPQHFYFQLGFAFFFMAMLAPHNPFGMLWLRSILVIGCVLMAMYGWLIECTPDIVIWAGLILVVNLIYLIILLCRLRPIRFDKEIESVYISLFKPLRVSRHQFKAVLNCMKLIRSLKYQEIYAQEKVTKVDSLSLVLSGKLVVSQNQKALHIVFPHQFLDSPEWFGVSTDDYFQVSIMAMEESRVLIWHRDKLKLSIMTEPFLQAVFDHILGRDVVKKLMQVTQVSETMASNGFLPSGGYDDAEDKPMLVLKKNNEGHGLTALINKQLQANDPNSWRLGRIDEADHETAV